MLVGQRGDEDVIGGEATQQVAAVGAAGEGLTRGRLDDGEDRRPLEERANVGRLLVERLGDQQLVEHGAGGIVGP